MPLTIWWVSSTPAGDKLGALAAAQTHVELTMPSWLTAPLEPLRWFDVALSVLPHRALSLTALLLLSLLLSGLVRRRRGWRDVVATAVALTLTMAGALECVRAIDTRLSAGVSWVTPDTAPFRLANLHAHSQASGGALMPEDLVSWHHQRGFRVLAITDSNGMRAVERAQAWVAASGLPMVIVPGEEYRGTTHLLMFNLRTPVLPAEHGVPEAVAEARRQGGLVIAAHPWTADRSPSALVDAGVGGFEVTNGSWIADTETQALARQKGLALTGDLDYREGATPMCATVLPLWADTPARVQQALERGECAALYLASRVSHGNWTRGMPARFARSMLRLIDERLAMFLVGVLFWALLLIAARVYVRWPSCPLPARGALVCVLACTGVTAAFTLWCVWWQFRVGWYPRTEWAMALWAVATPVAWWALSAVRPAEEGNGG